MKNYEDLETIEKKEIWWQHLLSMKNFWHYGWTARRLEKKKAAVFADRITWDDLFSRHSGNEYSPDEMKKYDNHVYLHGFGSFAGNVGSIVRVGM